jgi:L-amino acid N-acyltransferase YncA
VHPAARSRGLSRALLTQALAQESGALLAVIKPENLASIRLFEGAGFVLEGTHDGLSRYVRPSAGAGP